MESEVWYVEWWGASLLARRGSGVGRDPAWLSLPAAVCLGCYKILVTMLFLAPAGACTGLFLFLLLPGSARDWFTPMSLPNDGETTEGSELLKLRSQSPSWPSMIHLATSRQVIGQKATPQVGSLLLCLQPLRNTWPGPSPFRAMLKYPASQGGRWVSEHEVGAEGPTQTWRDKST